MTTCLGLSRRSRVKGCTMVGVPESWDTGSHDLCRRPPCWQKGHPEPCPLLARKGCGCEDDSSIEACRRDTYVAGADRCGATRVLPMAKGAEPLYRALSCFRLATLSHNCSLFWRSSSSDEAQNETVQRCSRSSCDTRGETPRRAWAPLM